MDIIITIGLDHIIDGSLRGWLFIEVQFRSLQLFERT
jgi:hypothetical protein